MNNRRKSSQQSARGASNHAPQYQSNQLSASLKQNENKLLALLPADEYARLLPDLQAIRLKKGEVLCHAGDEIRFCYFPSNGMISLLSITGTGETVEVSMVGANGMAGVPAILQIGVSPYEIMVQIEADAMRIKADALRKAFDAGGKLQTILLRYTHSLLCQVSQSAVCNRFHTVEQRLCRWLLISRDRVQSNRIALTQEFISRMLGVPRTNVTMTLGAVERAGLISCGRGLITIIDSQRLEAAACECYRIVVAEIDKLYR